MMPKNLSVQLIAWIVATLCVLGGIRIALDSSKEQQATVDELERTARTLADVVGHQLIRTYTLEQVREMQGFVNELKGRQADLLLAEVLDGGGQVLASSDLDRLDLRVLTAADLQGLRRADGVWIVNGGTEVQALDIYRSLVVDAEGGGERGILHLQTSTARLHELARWRTLRGLGVTVGEMLMLGGLLFFLVRSQVVRPLATMAAHVTAVSEGRILPFTVGRPRRDEVGALATGLQAMTTRLLDLIEQLRADGGVISDAGDRLVQTSGQLSGASTQQATALTEVSATVREVAQASSETSALAERVVAQAKQSEESSQSGLQAVDEAGKAMHLVDEQMHTISSHMGELAERMQQIGELIGAVNALTERSHLLALNASIEAAKAGESGRGFAVVAAEMRALAEGSRRSTEQVRATLGDVQRAMRLAVENQREGSERTKVAFDLSRQAGAAIARLAEVIANSAQMARQIAAATQQQTLGVSQASTALDQSRTATEQTVQNAHQLQGAAEELRRVAHGMFSLVDDLVGGHKERPAVRAEVAS